jgi:hypothetical protein
MPFSTILLSGDPLRFSDADMCLGDIAAGMAGQGPRLCQEMAVIHLRLCQPPAPCIVT